LVDHISYCRPIYLGLLYIYTHPASSWHPVAAVAGSVGWLLDGGAASLRVPRASRASQYTDNDCEMRRRIQKALSEKNTTSESASIRFSVAACLRLVGLQMEPMFCICIFFFLYMRLYSMQCRSCRFGCLFICVFSTVAARRIGMCVCVCVCVCLSYAVTM